MLLAKREGYSVARARDLLTRFDKAGGLRIKKTKGTKILYVTKDGTRHLLWDPQPNGTITLEEHDARCDC